MFQQCLIVDDSPAFLDSARAALESQGVTVAECATCSEEALAAAKSFEFDLALVDVELAGEDGFVLARLLAAQDPALRIVLISAYELIDIEEPLATSGAAGFITKTELGRKAIEALLES
jgi:CheY-like chemotaxis protein